MKFNDKEMEIVVKFKANGDFAVESNCREHVRVVHVLNKVVRAMNAEMNRLRGRLVLPNNHVGHFERSVN